jgi:hypothetical protein
MYTPKAFEVADLALLHAAMKQSELATLVTMTTQGLVATHLPLLLDEAKGEYGTLTPRRSSSSQVSTPMCLLTGTPPSRRQAEWCQPGTTPPFMPMDA